MGNIVIPTNVIVGDPDLNPGNILGGKNILGVEGAITKRQGGEFPGYERATAFQGTSTRLHMFVPKGAYIDGTVFDGNLAGIFADDADYTAANIKSGVDIFGVAGTLGVKILTLTDTVAVKASGIAQWDCPLAFTPSLGTPVCVTYAVPDLIYDPSPTKTVQSTLSVAIYNSSVTMTSWWGTNPYPYDLVGRFFGDGTTFTLRVSLSQPLGGTTPISDSNPSNKTLTGLKVYYL